MKILLSSLLLVGCVSYKNSNETLDRFVAQVSKVSDVEKCIIIAKSYCEGISDISGSKELIFELKNGKKVKCADGKKYNLKNRDEYIKQVNNVDASDILKQDYPYSYDFISIMGNKITASDLAVPIKNFNYSPGRFRNDDLLISVYGASTKEVKAKTRVVDFLGVPTMFSTANGAADALENVVKQIRATGFS